MSGKHPNSDDGGNAAKKAKFDQPLDQPDGEAVPVEEDVGLGVAAADAMVDQAADGAAGAAIVELPPPPVEQLAGPLRRWLQCEKCGSTVTRCFKVCHRGHLACEKCVKNLRTKCPRCKVRYITESPEVVRKLLTMVNKLDARGP